MKIVNIKEIVGKDDLYDCTDKELQTFFEQNGLDYVISDELGGKTTWKYIKCKKLLELLTTFENNKKQLKGGEILDE